MTRRELFQRLIATPIAAALPVHPVAPPQYWSLTIEWKRKVEAAHLEFEKNFPLRYGIGHHDWVRLQKELP